MDVFACANRLLYAAAGTVVDMEELPAGGARYGIRWTVELAHADSPEQVGARRADSWRCDVCGKRGVRSCNCERGGA